MRLISLSPPYTITIINSYAFILKILFCLQYTRSLLESPKHLGLQPVGQPYRMIPRLLVGNMSGSDVLVARAATPDMKILAFGGRSHRRLWHVVLVQATRRVDALVTNVGGTFFFIFGAGKKIKK